MRRRLGTPSSTRLRTSSSTRLGTSPSTRLGTPFISAWYDASDQQLPWDTSNVRNMRWMFCDALTFNQQHPWDTHNVDDMSQMFRGAIAFDQSLSHWDTRNVTTMDHMFYEAPWMLRRYPDGNLRPPIDPWGQVRNQFMHGGRLRRRWR